MKLNLGCSDRHQVGYLNVDIVEPADQIVDLSVFPWPWEADSVSEIIAEDIIEHLPNDDKINVMNEIHRILVQGGIIKIKIPTTEGAGAWCDPTHKSWWNRQSFWYYTKGNPAYERFHKAYGVTACFTVLHERAWAWENMPLLDIDLMAVK